MNGGVLNSVQEAKLRWGSEAVYRGSVIQNGTDERLIQRQECFLVAAGGRMGKILKDVGGSYVFGLQFLYMGKRRVASMKTEAQNFDSFGDWNGVVLE